jgi:hypothetical protein
LLIRAARECWLELSLGVKGDNDRQFTNLGYQLTVCWETWQRLREQTRYRATRRGLVVDLRKSYEALIDTKARALKSTGITATRHENLEAAILNLAAAIEDYRDHA